jgi:hypothetical protein
MIDGEFYVRRGQVMTMAEEELIDGFRTLQSKFFPHGDEKVARVPAGGAGESSKPKVIPFNSPSRILQRDLETFETGTEINDSDSSKVDSPGRITAVPQQSLQRIVPVGQPDNQQKTIWKTFGENEDV